MFNAFSGSGARLVAAGGTLPAVFLFIVALHSLVLALNYGLSRLMRLDRASTSAFTIHTSQKTLTVSYVVWAGSFAAHYPLALIPGIVYHLTQMVVDTFVAERFKKFSPSSTRARHCPRGSLPRLLSIMPSMNAKPVDVSRRISTPSPQGERR